MRSAACIQFVRNERLSSSGHYLIASGLGWPEQKVRAKAARVHRPLHAPAPPASPRDFSSRLARANQRERPLHQRPWERGALSGFSFSICRIFPNGAIRARTLLLCCCAVVVVELLNERVVSRLDGERMRRYLGLSLSLPELIAAALDGRELPGARP